MIRVLHIANARMGSGGTETFLMNLYRNIDREKIQFDFVVFSNEEGMHEKEITELGGRIYRVPRKKEGLIKNFNGIRKIVKENNYQVVHRHCGSAVMVFDILAAKMGGAQCVIGHSHSTNNEHWLLHKLCRPLLNRVCNYRFACSEMAARWMYGKKATKVIANGIESENFRFNKKKRDEKREELGIAEDEMVYGNIAGLQEVKNQAFLIDVFEIIHKKNKNTKLFLVGIGELRERLEAKVRSLGLEEVIVFLGQRTDIAGLLCALDVFVLPSLYEGLPLTMVEAQCSGVSCVISDKVPEECILNDELVKQIALSETRESWAQKLMDVTSTFDREQGVTYIRDAGYDINQSVKYLQEVYIKIHEEKEG